MKTFSSVRRWATTAALVASFGWLSHATVQAGDPPKAKATIKPYPLQVCAVSGDKLAKQKKQTYALQHQGQEVKLCSADCVQAFNAQPAPYLKKLERSGAPAKVTQKQAGWTLANNQLFAVGDAPSRQDWGAANW